MRLAKNCFDLGLMVDQGQFRLEDWTRGVGLDLDCIIEIEGLRQHRFQIGQAVLKVNVATDPLAASPPSGLVAFAVRGRRFVLSEGVPVGAENGALAGAEGRADRGLDAELASTSVGDAMRFYTGVMGLEQVGRASVRCGPAFLAFRGDGPLRTEVPLFGPGIRYLTFQVFDADEACAAAQSAGAKVGRAPVDYGDVARYGFVLDPDGNWIEMSARTSVIGAHENT